MLLERASALAARIARQKVLKASASEAEVLRTRAAQVREAAAQLCGQQVALQRLQEAGVPVPFRPADAEAHVGRARSLKAILKEDPAGLAAPSFNLRHEFTDRLKGIAEGARAAAEQAWRDQVLILSPTTSDEVLRTLGRLPPLRSSVERIMAARARIQDLSRVLPPDPTAAKGELARLVADQRAAWAALSADDVPPAVIGFLRACGSEGATLTALTDEVRAWLEGRGLLASFRIRIV